MNKSMAEMHRIRSADSVSPICMPSEIRVDRFLDSSPPTRTWILENLLPLGIVGLLAASGGTGKSLLTLQLALSVATGQSFLGIKVKSPGGVLMICAEDDSDELHRRFAGIVSAMRRHGQFGKKEEAAVRDKLYIASRVGGDNLMTRVHQGKVERTDIGERIALTAGQINDIKLIVLDPVSRFRGGDENNNDHATRFVESVEALRATTEASILMPHHIHKDARKDKSAMITAANVRGATALVDGVRWVATMDVLSMDCAKRKCGIEPNEALNYVRFDVVKNNYAAHWEGMWTRRQPDGLLVPVDIKTIGQKKARQQKEEEYQNFVPKLKKFIELENAESRPVTRRGLRKHAGLNKTFGVSDHSIREFVPKAIADGHIHEVLNGRHKELKL